jgi:hypothetical protein
MLEGAVPNLKYTPNSNFNGVDFFTYTVSDDLFTTEETTVTFSIGLTYCKIYPYALEHSQFTDLQAGYVFNNYLTETGNGNYSLLTWNGANDTNTLAMSFTAPGNSENYINPDDENDNTIDINDWLQGAPGKNNANHVRNALDLLIGETITVPLWSQTRNTGSRMDYQVAGFTNIELTDYQLQGNSNISFIYHGAERCLNYAPVTYDNNFEAETQTPYPFVLGTENTTIDGVPHLPAVFDEDNDELSYIITTQPQHGTLTGEGTEFTYTSNPDYEGQDSFSFKVNDGKADSNISTISINVIDPNVAPVAENQNITTDEDQSINITLVATDENGDELTYQITSQPFNGTLTGTAPNLTYTPNLNYFGSDEFQFIANDGELDSQIATISITINPVNDVPVVNDISFSTNEDQPVAIQFTGPLVSG